MLHSTSSTSKDNNTEEKVYLPLPFWFTLNPGLALPIISLISQSLEIMVQFPNLHNVENSKYALKPDIWQTAEMIVEYVFLDDTERRHFA